LYELACVHEHGEGGCPLNKERAVELYRRSAELGNVFASNGLARMINDKVECFDHFMRSALQGAPAGAFLDTVSECVARFRADKRARPDLVFAAGKVLKGRVDVTKQTLLDMSVESFVGLNRCKRFFEASEFAVKFFHQQCVSTRKAVDAWTLVGLRLKVVKDIRKLIAQIVWDFRRTELVEQEPVQKGKKQKTSRV
jgi:hypothetical protein